MISCIITIRNHSNSISQQLLLSYLNFVLRKQIIVYDMGTIFFSSDSLVLIQNIFSIPFIHHINWFHIKKYVCLSQLKLKRLPLNRHSKDKILRLLHTHYNEKTDEVTITADRCPLRQQNYDYAMYLLTALFHESWVSREIFKRINCLYSTVEHLQSSE